MTFMSLLKQPSAVIPLGISFAAFVLMIAVLSTVGFTYQQDEGTPARIFQLLILLQVPLVAFFAVKWLPGALALRSWSCCCKSVRRSWLSPQLSGLKALWRPNQPFQQLAPLEYTFSVATRKVVCVAVTTKYRM